jgi:23S rRNA (pseudouridine1915-N3)-methyltransferase
VKISIVAVGKIKERFVREAIDDYAGRIRRYATLDERELDDGPDGQLADAIAKAARGATVVPLDSRGDEVDSRGFAAWLERLSRTARGTWRSRSAARRGWGRSAWPWALERSACPR